MYVVTDICILRHNICMCVYVRRSLPEQYTGDNPKGTTLEPRKMTATMHRDRNDRYRTVRVQPETSVADIHVRTSWCDMDKFALQHCKKIFRQKNG